jgi:NadR type nicotinamide-nucleotide adenylyltransferase
MTTGLIWGKFMPLHNGHCYLIERARERVDHLTILLCSVKSQPIPGAVRYGWLMELYPALDVQHCSDEIPQYPQEAATVEDYWKIWLPVLRRYLPNGLDFLFTSETYGDTLAPLLGARHICIDPERLTYPISGTVVRQNPQAHWKLLPPMVQAYYARVSFTR